MNGPTDCHTEWSQTEKNKYHMISLICGIFKKGTDELINRTEIVTDVEDNLWLLGVKGRDKLENWDWHIDTTTYKTGNKDLLNSTGNSTQYL